MSVMVSPNGVKLWGKKKGKKKRGATMYIIKTVSMKRTENKQEKVK